MEDFKIIELYDKTPEKLKSEFVNNTNSSVRVVTDYEKTIKDTEWIRMFEETIPYIDNILRNPNRFIVNEEDIVKIELARKITVDSIKHLSKNTNLIQDIDKKTGDVRPSKILNINKEESYDTYENKLIYTLIQNMKAFINQKKKNLNSIEECEFKNDKQIEYNGKTNYSDEDIEMSFSIKTKVNNTKDKSEDNILERIIRVEQKINDLTSSEVYKILEKKHISLIRPPIKKTNVVLKNVNFQYAVKLWNYIQDNFDDKTQNISEKSDYLDNGDLKKLADETFLLNYLVVNTLNKDQAENEEITNKLKENIVDQMLDKIMDLDSSLTEEQLKEMIGNKYSMIKYKKMATMQEIQMIFSKHIDQYLERIND